MDRKYMKRALELAEKGRGFTSPNPMVGAVIVKNGQIIGEGYHERFGEAHAEVNAIDSATEPVEGGTIYVTLEPCSHYGKTPPCSDLIIDRKLKKVVVAAMDPNPLVSGRGLDRLRKAGIEVVEGVLEAESNKLNEVFNKFITTQTPFVLMKYAMSLDGKIATQTGDSKWISSEKSREHAHHLRGYLSGIMVGIGTVLKDDPQLTCRVPGYPNPVRILLDSQLRVPLDSKILKDQDEAQTLILTTEHAPLSMRREIEKLGVEVLTVPERDEKVDLKAARSELGKKGIDSILLEGGGTLNAAALEAGIVDKVTIYIAPKIIGGAEAISPVMGRGVETIKDAYGLSDLQVTKLNEDIFVEGYLREEN
ncbi:diaminohydroxyphosphoribosylaminopyrimidine deaminase [Alkalibacterium putridalgicola]|uniref:Riboflavin biosynthesis protein RibD n=1 Tax=Alkalibacterium putridalgicola TaxID=426703 RepID=A0A1H7VY44_9LACT|nr:bifunctional diaminohydroxyphosphoribosylaminopyrimidine deaminase/5-amino-6-(5-phosphoribosylamino)uracil reductase RibD [Alkalibacterium putridalgicola]GEK89368.1 riboflavin biosynthesis protein RibD [Alkalibacterium putridalgicola]SEM13984.1 diaminohydroxyphosphoribosylaminopyrimidine deaminase [Alkalibacterium putridalgicola]